MMHTENGADDTGAPGPSPAAELLTPEQRLTQSRARLRTWFEKTYPLEATDKATQRAHAPPASDADEPAWLSSIFDMLSDVPAATVAARWLRRWWARHPWRETADLAIAITRELAEPAAKRHPWLLVGSAVLAGVAISRARPWRWISGGAILASMVPRLEMGAVMRWVTTTMGELVARQHARHTTSPEDGSTSHDGQDNPAPPPDAPHFPAPGSSSLH